MEVVGIDVGARLLDAVALDGEGGVVGAAVFSSADVEGLVAWAARARAVAVDAPDAWSTAPHADDEGLAPKFRSARCAEIALGRIEGMWVPWTTPVEAAPDTWIDVGIRVFAALRDAGHQALEVFPHATFRVLGGGRRPPKKQTVEGARTRIELLRAAGVSAPAMASWGHDALDAASAALVAQHHTRGTAKAVTCGHDGSAIWLPPLSGPGTTT